jgi:Phosphate transporter family
MLSFLAQGLPATIGFLIACLALVLAFQFSNGFHDTANPVATVICTNTLKPLYAVVWSGLMNFLGVLLGGNPRGRCHIAARRPREVYAYGFLSRRDGLAPRGHCRGA